MDRRATNLRNNAAAVALSTVVHVALLVYLALNLKPFATPYEQRPFSVELITPFELEPPPPPPLPPLRSAETGRLDPAELPALRAEPSPAPQPDSPPEPQPQPERVPVLARPQTAVERVQQPRVDRAPVRSQQSFADRQQPQFESPPTPPVLAADVVELAPESPPVPQAPRPATSAAIRAFQQPDFAAGDPPPGSAQSASAGASNPAGAANPATAGAALREAVGGPGNPAGSPNGVDDRWRVRPDGGGYADCPPIPRERMTPAQRERCFPTPPSGRLNTDYDFKLKDTRFDEAARRKEQIRVYKSAPAAQYPGLNCVFRGKCK